MRRNTRLIVVGWMLATLAVAGFTIVGLSYVVVFPEALPVAYLVLTFTTVVVGGVLCRPYLRIAGRGFTLGPAGRHVGWWIPTFGHRRLRGHVGRDTQRRRRPEG